MVHPAVFHPLTPGSPAYAMLKLGAVASVFALRLHLKRRERRRNEAPAQVATEPAAEPQPAAHPVSRKKKRRRRR
jgi:hypothetical protein